MVSTDLTGALALFQVLATGPVPSDPDNRARAFDTLIAFPGTTVMAAFDGDTPVSMATLHLLPAMTNNARPYGLIENVATLARYRGRGMARAVMRAVIAQARQTRAYKLMLLTGRQNLATGFYEKIGFDGDDKAGFVLRLP